MHQFKPGHNMGVSIEPNMEIERTYRKYIGDIQNLNLSSISASLGLLKKQDHYCVPFFNTFFSFTPDGFLSSALRGRVKASSGEILVRTQEASGIGWNFKMILSWPELLALPDR